MPCTHDRPSPQADSAAPRAHRCAPAPTDTAPAPATVRPMLETAMALDHRTFWPTHRIRSFLHMQARAQR